MSNFSITNTQGIVSKASLASQVQDGVNRGQELAAEHASQNIKDEHTVNLEKVAETNKPEEGMDRDANPEEMQEHESEDQTDDDKNKTEEEPLPPGHPDSKGHIDLTA